MRPFAALRVTRPFAAICCARVTFTVVPLFGASAAIAALLFLGRRAYFPADVSRQTRQRGVDRPDHHGLTCIAQLVQFLFRLLKFIE